MIGKLKKQIYRGSEIGYKTITLLTRIVRYMKYQLFSEVFYEKRRYRKSQGREINLKQPKLFSEKLIWLKLYDRKPLHTLVCDKYEAPRYFASMFGDEYIIPPIFVSDNYKDVVPEKFPDYPFIIKSNHASGQYVIVRDKTQVNWDEIQFKCRTWLDVDYSIFANEWQYKDIKRKIIAEKLLICNDGDVPNDIKFSCFNGKCEYIYVVSGRFGKTLRKTYDINWNALPFIHEVKNMDLSELEGEDHPRPVQLDKMIEMAEQIAKDFKYVRVDFYDKDGVIYFGEITLCDSGGEDVFDPIEWDSYYGDKLIL